MASKRMISVRIVNSGRFLKMPLFSQVLYFHLNIRADDDGVVEAYPIIFLLGCTEEDFNILVENGFVKVLNDDLVCYITDWNEHNKIRADRKIDSIYKNLLLEKVPDVELVQKRPRADSKQYGQTMDCPRTDKGQAKDSLGKVRLGKDSINKQKYDFEKLKKIVDE